MPIRIKTNETTDAWRAMLLAHRRVTHELDRDLRTRTDLNLGWYEVLLVLAASGDERLRMNELADKMILSRSATTRLVDRLERDGLVERFVCDSDRRGMEVMLTDEGRAKFLEAGRIHFSGIQDRFGGHLTDEELATITLALGRVAEANAHPGTDHPCPS